MKHLPLAVPHMTETEAEEVFGWILDGEASEEEIARFLLAMTERSETAEEIAGAARALRARLLPVAAPEGAVDCCGTGGDGHHTLNVSTAVSLVVAAAAPHRLEAFLATQYAVDRIKHIVPVWKKEHFTNGSVWIGVACEPEHHARELAEAPYARFLAERESAQAGTHQHTHA